MDVLAIVPYLHAPTRLQIASAGFTLRAIELVSGSPFVVAFSSDFQQHGST